ncbi:hypothetical protein D3C75_1342510 [compost metagenome]
MAVKGRRRPFNDVDALKEPRIHLNHVVAAAVAHQAQAIEEGIVNIAAVETA